MNYVKQLRLCHGKPPLLEAAKDYPGAVRYKCQNFTCGQATTAYYSSLGNSEEMAREAWDSGIVSVGGVYEDWMAGVE